MIYGPLIPDNHQSFTTYDKNKPLADHRRDGGDCNLRNYPEHGRVLILSCADRGDRLGRNQTNLR